MHPINGYKKIMQHQSPTSYDPCLPQAGIIVTLFLHINPYLPAKEYSNLKSVFIYLFISISYK